VVCVPVLTTAPPAADNPAQGVAAILPDPLSFPELMSQRAIGDEGIQSVAPTACISGTFRSDQAKNPG